MIPRKGHPRFASRFCEESVEYFKSLGYTDNAIGVFFRRSESDVRYFRKRMHIPAYRAALAKRWQEARPQERKIRLPKGWRMSAAEIAELYGAARYADAPGLQAPGVVGFIPLGRAAEGITLGGVSDYGNL